MLKPSICILALATMSLPAIANDDILPDLKKGQPQQVKALIDRIFICNHLAGEVGDDKEGMKDLLASMRQYRCARVDADEAKMLVRYKNNRKVIDALDAARGPSEQIDVDP
jgi:hypothetical protein